MRRADILNGVLSILEGFESSFMQFRPIIIIIIKKITQALVKANDIVSEMSGKSSRVLLTVL